MKLKLYPIVTVTTLGLLGGLCLSLAVVMALTPFATVAHEEAPRFQHALLEADVEVLLDGGHGSGVHIGNGFYLTAGHVASAATKRLDLKFHDGSIRPAKVLWINKEKDVALLQADGDGVVPAHLSCKVYSVGTDVVLKGNPTVMENITAWGRIAGDSAKNDLWDNVQVLNATVIPGQSGGPVYEESTGDLIGLSVGVALVPIGFTPSVTNYGYMVPGDTLCQLLGRVQ